MPDDTDAVSGWTALIVFVVIVFAYPLVTAAVTFWG